jgi:hypothetical protein
MNVFLWQSILLAAIAIVASLVVVPRLVETYRGFRGRRFVLCPETRLPAEVKVNAALAVLSTAVAGGRPCLRLSECSRWPERRNCGQECLAQVEASPDGCLVRSIVQDLYAGTSCALCGRRLGEFRWYEHYPAALSPEGVTVEWNTIPLEKLPEVLATYSPICWNCHIAETFRRGHGDLVTHRPTHIRSVA